MPARELSINQTVGSSDSWFLSTLGMLCLLISPASYCTFEPQHLTWSFTSSSLQAISVTAGLVGQADSSLMLKKPRTILYTEDVVYSYLLLVLTLRYSWKLQNIKLSTRTKTNIELQKKAIQMNGQKQQLTYFLGISRPKIKMSTSRKYHQQF